MGAITCFSCLCDSVLQRRSRGWELDLLDCKQWWVLALLRFQVGAPGPGTIRLELEAVVPRRLFLGLVVAHWTSPQKERPVTERAFL